ncbi:MAG: hypothetical protein V3V71_14190 [Roseateles sp.]
MESGFRHLNIALLAVSAATLAAGLLARYLRADQDKPTRYHKPLGDEGGACYVVW